MRKGIIASLLVSVIAVVMLSGAALAEPEAATQKVGQRVAGSYVGEMVSNDGLYEYGLMWDIAPREGGTIEVDSTITNDVEGLMDDYSITVSDQVGSYGYSDGTVALETTFALHVRKPGPGYEPTRLDIKTSFEGNMNTGNGTVDGIYTMRYSYLEDPVIISEGTFSLTRASGRACSRGIADGFWTGDMTSICHGLANYGIRFKATYETTHGEVDFYALRNLRIEQDSASGLKAQMLFPAGVAAVVESQQVFMINPVSFDICGQEFRFKFENGSIYNGNRVLGNYELEHTTGTSGDPYSLDYGYIDASRPMLERLMNNLWM